MADAPQLIYLGRSRLHRSRANLIQTLHTVAAMGRVGASARLFLPPWPRRFNAAKCVHQMGIDEPIDLQPSAWLHPRFGFHPFVWRHRRTLKRSPIVYTRVPEISLALARAGITHHLEVHDVDKLDRLGRLDPIVDAHRAGRIGLLVPISHSAAELLVQAGAEPPRLHVAPSGVDTRAYASIPPFDADRLDRPRIVHLGRLSPERGLAVFEALQRSGLCELTLIGDESLSASVDARPPIPLRDVPGRYGECDIAVLPYQPTIDTARSMSPIKLFEAMAAGRPIVVSDLPVVREIVDHERHALLIEPADTGRWLEAIRRLQRDRDLATRLAANARAEAARYDWRERARGILGAIDRLTQPEHARRPRRDEDHAEDGNPV